MTETTELRGLVQIMSHPASNAGVRVTVKKADGTLLVDPPVALGPMQALVGVVGMDMTVTLEATSLADVTTPTDPEGPQLTDAHGNSLKSDEAPKLVLA